MGASAEPTGLAGPEGPEPPSRLGASHGIPSAAELLDILAHCSAAWTMGDKPSNTDFQDLKRMHAQMPSNRYKAEAINARMATSWQPIETAPEFKIVAVATYEMPFGWWRAFGAAQLVNGRWLHCLGDHIEEPTHWLPLPYGPGGGLDECYPFAASADTLPKGQDRETGLGRNEG